MRRLALFGLFSMLLFSCGGGENADVQHYPNCDVSPIYTMDGAGNPSWSPEGDKIAFVYESHLWTVTPEGAEVTQITSLSGQEMGPSWCPVTGSNKLVFVNTTGPDNFTIYTLILGGEPKVIKSFTTQISSVSWSKDGEKIVFLQTGKKDIFTIPAVGGEVSSIPNSEGWGNLMVISRASKARNTVLYVDVVKGDYRINEIDVDGGDPANKVKYTMTSGGGAAVQPYAMDESYDGTMIVFTSTVDAGGGDVGWSLFLVPSAGGKTEVLIPGLHEKMDNPTWSPSNDKLAIEMRGGIKMVELKLK